MTGKGRMVGLLALVILLRLAIAALLRFLPYRYWQPLLVSAMREALPGTCGNWAAVQRVSDAIVESERILPVGQCLERALTAWLVLRRSAPCTVRVGANLGQHGKPFAHAWLEYRGQVVLGRSTDNLHTLYPPHGPARRGHQRGTTW